MYPDRKSGLLNFIRKDQPEQEKNRTLAKYLKKEVQRFRKISAILLSLLVLLSSTSFTFNMHFCMGQLESVALFSDVDPCEMAQQKTPCASIKHNPDCKYKQVAKKGCCEDRTLVLEGSEELSIVKSVSIPDVHMTAVLYAMVSFIFTSPSVSHYSFNDYSPPLIERDIPVLIQSFLI